MESNINYNPTIMRDISGKVIETKRQNPAKSVIKKLLRVDLMDSIKEMDSNKEAKSTAVTSPTLAQVKAKMASGQKLTNEEMQVLLDNIKKTEAEYNIKRTQRLRTTQSAKTEFPPKTYPSASDKYLQLEEKIRRIENAARTKSTVYRPLDNKVKGGFERAIDKMHQLVETKAELAERSAKMAKKFAKLLEFCKKIRQII